MGPIGSLLATAKGEQLWQRHVTYHPCILENTMKKLVKRLCNEEDGATAVEYGIMVAAIAAVIITIVISVGAKTNTAFTKVDTGLDQVAAP